jgi:hypothetical protein
VVALPRSAWSALRVQNTGLVLPIRVSVEEFLAIMCADDLAVAGAAIRDQTVAGQPIGPARSCLGW